MLGITSTKKLANLMVGAGLALAPMGAGAFSITSADLPQYGTDVNLGFATVTAVPTTFTHKSVAGYDVVGILGGYEGGEVDLAKEAMVFEFTTPSVIANLDLGLLFKAGEEDDLYNEIAKVIVYTSQGEIAYTLTVIDATTAAWSGPGTVTNVSPATYGNAAVWSISNPFGDAAVNGFALVGEGPDAPTDYRNNDYGFVGLNGRAVPEPGTLMLMGFGLLGLGAAGRKRS